MRSRYDVVVVGGGHNGLVAAAYLAQAGKSVLVLERLPETGGAAVSQAPSPGIAARVSRYAYLVSLLPAPDRARARAAVPHARAPRLLVHAGPGDRPRRARRRGDPAAWDAFYARCARVARAVAPTLLEPLPRVRTCAARSATTRPGRACSSGRWASCSRRVAGRRRPARDGATDGLIGTFAGAHDADLRQNRCFLYHVIGNGTGRGACRSAAWARSPRRSRLRGGRGRRARDGRRGRRDRGGRPRGRGARTTATTACDHVIAGCAPAVLAQLAGLTPEVRRGRASSRSTCCSTGCRGCATRPSTRPTPSPARSASTRPTTQLAAAYGRPRSRAASPTPRRPSSTATRSPTRRSSAPSWRDGAHTLTLFGLQTPARLFDADNAAARRGAGPSATSTRSTRTWPSRSATASRAMPSGRPCVEAKSPLDLERELRLPRGNIFHGDLGWPCAERDERRRHLGRRDGDPRACTSAARARAAAAASAAWPGTTPRDGRARLAALGPLADLQVADAVDDLVRQIREALELGARGRHPKARGSCADRPRGRRRRRCPSGPRPSRSSPSARRARSAPSASSAGSACRRRRDRRRSRA